MKKTMTIFLFLSLVAGLAVAKEKTHDKKRHGPPTEAIEACSDKTEGDLVTFENRRGDTLEGTCKLMKEVLVAIPEGHERRRLEKREG
jgi:hypothetical protein